jgi:primosomal protein N' (replication factor Y)
VLNEEWDAGVGSLASVPFHGRTVKGWILGPASEMPKGKLAPIRKVFGPTRFFDGSMLRLLRWMGERYIAPLSTVIERSHPPRVASEETAPARRRVARGGPAERQAREAGGNPGVNSRRASSGLLAMYGGAESILTAGRTTWLRPLPGQEGDVCVAAVEACVGSGKRALILVPEADPLPGTAAAVLERFGGAAGAFLGGDGRTRYRTWLEIRAGAFDVVVATRPGIFAPIGDLGLIWVSREVHPGHREDRAPYYRVSDVAPARARIHGAACVLASFSPSVETAAGVASGAIRVARPSRAVERAASPLVETTVPEAEDRSVRLGQLLKGATSAALIVSRRGYGVARVCRSCGEPAACAICRGPIIAEGGKAVCRVCRATGSCSNCGGATFGVERGGSERIAEWAARVARAPVDRPAEEELHGPTPGRILVGTASVVKDVGRRSLDLVAILDPDRAMTRAGFHAGEQSLATWMEAAAWAAPRDGGGRVLAQTRHAGHPAIQALVRWEPMPFLLGEASRRTEAGLPPGHPLFRVEGAETLPEELNTAGGAVVVARTESGRTVCLTTVRPEGLARFHGEILRLVERGIASRVEAEPQL